MRRRWREAADLFASRPRAARLLALALVLLGLVAVSGWVPPSAHRARLPGQEWLLAIACWVVALAVALATRSRR